MTLNGFVCVDVPLINIHDSHIHHMCGIVCSACEHNAAAKFRIKWQLSTTLTSSIYDLMQCASSLLDFCTQRFARHYAVMQRDTRQETPISLLFGHIINLN